MPDNTQKVYQFSTLSEYSFKDRFVIRLIGLLGYLLTYLICITMRTEVEGTDYLDDAGRGYDAPIICAWHERILPGAYFLRGRGLVVMSSISFDAEYTARVIQRFGFGVIKGSSTRGGTRALIEMIRLMEKGIPSTFTVDGPRGPRYEVKPGPPLLAKRTGDPMLPFSIDPRSYWTINSWDKLRIPKPFTKAKVYFGEPIFVAKDANDDELEQKRLELQNALSDLSRRGDDWAENSNS
ncbi:lysophospholipid acyltransferase family protein [soil metagenome]